MVHWSCSVCVVLRTCRQTMLGVCTLLLTVKELCVDNFVAPINVDVQNSCCRCAKLMFFETIGTLEWKVVFTHCLLSSLGVGNPRTIIVQEAVLDQVLMLPALGVQVESTQCCQLAMCTCCKLRTISLKVSSFTTAILQWL